VVSLPYGVAQINTDHLDSTEASCLSALLGSLLPEMLLPLLDHGIALTPMTDPDSDTTFATTVPQAVD